jgi:hypothetical protein
MLCTHVGMIVFDGVRDFVGLKENCFMGAGSGSEVRWRLGHQCGRMDVGTLARWRSLVAKIE